MFSQTAEYALRAVSHLANAYPESRTTAQIAKATQVPSDYLAKVLKELGRAGVVQARRGLHGGFSLALSPDRLAIYDVVHAVSPIRRITACPLGIRAHAHGNLCPLHRLLDDSIAVVEKSLRSVTLHQLALAATDNSPLGEPYRKAVSLRIEAKPAGRSRSTRARRVARNGSSGKRKRL